MRVALSSVVCLLLVVSFGSLTHGDETDNQQSEAYEEGLSSILEEAGSTGSIHFKATRLHQFFDEECHTEEGREYRTADGHCNHVFNLGSANTPFRRMLPAAYGDSRNSPRENGEDGKPLPAATEVSRMILSRKKRKSRHTTMFMQWGQFIDHDVTLTPASTKPDGAIVCCGPNGEYPDQKLHPQCFPIKLSKDDANKRFKGKCMEFVRSLPARMPNGDELKPREQVNQITSFIDGSMIYGSSDDLQKQLREVKYGEPGSMMKTLSGLLPNNSAASCIRRDDEHCFLAGDVRVNVQPGLIVIHTMWVRLHNMIVDELAKKRPNDSPEDLFQEARKIVIGILQNIHYREWLPLVIGNKMQELYQLTPGKGRGDRVGYSSKVDPRLSNSFSTAAFRFGHSTIPEHLVVNKKKYEFRKLWFTTELVYDKFDDVVQALMENSWKGGQKNKIMVDDVTDHLFEPATQKKSDPSEGLDLAALNIQRGRDHGLLPFNKFRQICGLEPFTNFKSFGKFAKELSKLYRSVDDIDLFVGGLLEEPEDEAVVGPTFACIIAEQFHALKYGDRFYFETNRMPEGFTDGQLEAIRKVTFAHVCCLASGIDNVPKDVFSAKEKTLKCKKLKEDFLDFSLWKKTGSDPQESYMD